MRRKMIALAMVCAVAAGWTMFQSANAGGDKRGPTPVVRNRYAVWRVHIERLGQRRARAARSWITHVTNTDSAAQHLHMLLAKYVPHQAVTFALVEAVTVTGHNPSRILSPVLQYRKGIVYLGSDI